MAKPREYFHDRTILFLQTINVFLVVATAVSVILRLANNTSEDYIGEYRPYLGIDAFQSGGVVDIASFVGFGIIVFILQLIISKKIYHVRRDGSIIIALMTILALVFGLFVANALLTIS